MDIYNYFFPCQDIHDRRVDITMFVGKNRRISGKLSKKELKIILNNQFSHIANTLKVSRDVANND